MRWLSSWVIEQKKPLPERVFNNRA